jgi:hypothetical protein
MTTPIATNPGVHRGVAVAVHYANALSSPGIRVPDPMDPSQVACIIADLLDAAEACGHTPALVMDYVEEMREP